MKKIYYLLFLFLTACSPERSKNQSNIQDNINTNIETERSKSSKYLVDDFLGNYISKEGHIAHVINNKDMLSLQWVTGIDIYQKNSYEMIFQNDQLVSARPNSKIELSIKNINENVFNIFVDDNPSFEPINTELQKINSDTKHSNFEVSEGYIIDFRKEDHRYFIDIDFIDYEQDTQTGVMY